MFSTSRFYIHPPQQTLEALSRPANDAHAQGLSSELRNAYPNATQTYSESPSDNLPEYTSIAKVTKPSTIPPVDVRITPAVDPFTGRANATFLVLARNSDISGIETSMRSIEEKFNSRYNYPWTFFNDDDFDDDFKSRVLRCTNAEVQFGKVRRDWWDQPDWIVEERASEARERMANSGVYVPYAGSVSYRNMCRYNSGVRFRLFV